jgi:cytoskeletal protein RodZ
MENKKTIWIVIGVIVLIAIALLVWKMNTGTTPTDQIPTTQEPVADDTQGGATQGTAPTTGAGVTAAPSSITISYQDALKQYSTRRIQLNEQCQAVPNTVTYKDNSGIMIDNRSAQTRTVKVGTTFTIKPYGFKIVVLPDIYLKSQKILVDCDKMQNVATVLVQE